jgi:hypothetical protein
VFFVTKLSEIWVRPGIRENNYPDHRVKKHWSFGLKMLSLYLYGLAEKEFCPMVNTE